MPRIYRARDGKSEGRAGYSANYVADLVFRSEGNTAGVILVKIPAGIKTTPHSHSLLEEVFIINEPVTMYIDEISYSLEQGDTVVVEPDEAHCFKSHDSQDTNVIAIKVPNIKDDKVGH